MTKAEAIGQLVQANSLASLSQAVNQLQGKLFDKINSFREKISWVLSLINAQIDFIEEDVFFTHLKQVKKDLQKINTELLSLIDTADQGKIIQEGVRAVLLGAVNVGKSSLMNALLKEERSIVTATAGTTRDFIEESISIQNTLFYLTDTAVSIKLNNSVLIFCKSFLTCFKWVKKTSSSIKSICALMSDNTHEIFSLKELILSKSLPCS